MAASDTASLYIGTGSEPDSLAKKSLEDHPGGNSSGFSFHYENLVRTMYKVRVGVRPKVLAGEVRNDDINRATRDRNLVRDGRNHRRRARTAGCAETADSKQPAASVIVLHRDLEADRPRTQRRQRCPHQSRFRTASLRPDLEANSDRADDPEQPAGSAEPVDGDL